MTALEVNVVLCFYKRPLCMSLDVQHGHLQTKWSWGGLESLSTVWWCVQVPINGRR